MMLGVESLQVVHNDGDVEKLEDKHEEDTTLATCTASQDPLHKVETKCPKFLASLEDEKEPLGKHCLVYRVRDYTGICIRVVLGLDCS